MHGASVAAATDFLRDGLLILMVLSVLHVAGSVASGLRVPSFSCAFLFSRLDRLSVVICERLRLVY